MFLKQTETIINQITRIFCFIIISSIEYLETESRIGYSVSGTQANTNYPYDKKSQYALSQFGTQMADINSPGALCSVMDIEEIGNDVELQQDFTKLSNSHHPDLQIDKKRQSEYHHSRTSLTQLHQVQQRGSEPKQRSSQRSGQHGKPSDSLMQNHLQNLTQIENRKSQANCGLMGHNWPSHSQPIPFSSE